MGGFFFGCAVCALGQVPVSSGAVSDRIAEVVEAFPCLKFRVRLVFRHRLRACPSLTDAISIFSRSKWWGEEYRTRGSHLRSRTIGGIFVFCDERHNGERVH